MAFPSLTSTFTPPTSCLSEYNLHQYTRNDITTEIFVLGPPAPYDQCYPPSWDAEQIFSPGLVCPHGYSTACSQTYAAATHAESTYSASTIATCCPSNYQCATSKEVPGLDCTMVTTFSGSGMEVKYTRSYGETETAMVIASSGETLTVNAFAVVMEWQATDLLPLSPSTESTEIPPSPSCSTSVELGDQGSSTKSPALTTLETITLLVPIASYTGLQPSAASASQSPIATLTPIIAARQIPDSPPPLTTTFTPASGCLSQYAWSSVTSTTEGESAVTLSSFGLGVVTLGRPGPDPVCFPSGIPTTYFSPGFVCPTGYHQACTQAEDVGPPFVTTCCPSGYGCLGSEGGETGLLCATTFSGPSIITVVMADGTDPEPHQLQMEQDVVSAWGIVLMWQSSDINSDSSTGSIIFTSEVGLPVAGTVTTPSSSSSTLSTLADSSETSSVQSSQFTSTTPSAAASPPTADASASDSLTSSVQAAIGIGLGLALAFFLLLVIFFFMRHRQKRSWRVTPRGSRNNPASVPGLYEVREPELPNVGIRTSELPAEAVPPYTAWVHSPRDPEADAPVAQTTPAQSVVGLGVDTSPRRPTIRFELGRREVGKK